MKDTAGGRDGEHSEQVVAHQVFSVRNGKAAVTLSSVSVSTPVMFSDSELDANEVVSDGVALPDVVAAGAVSVDEVNVAVLLITPQSTRIPCNRPATYPSRQAGG